MDLKKYEDLKGLEIKTTNAFNLAFDYFRLERALSEINKLVNEDFSTEEITEDCWSKCDNEELQKLFDISHKIKERMDLIHDILKNIPIGINQQIKYEKLE